VITLTNFTYSLTDFQLEGVDAAITSWLAKELSVPNPWLGGSFDRERYRYDFEYSDGIVRGVPGNPYVPFKDPFINRQIRRRRALVWSVILLHPLAVLASWHFRAFR
jgi:hypothetical protein